MTTPLARTILDAKARRAVDRGCRALGDPRARPNLRWLASLLPDHLDEFSEIFTELRSLLAWDEAIRRRQLEVGRRSFAQFRAPFELYALVRLLKPRHVIETGVSSGVSSAHLLAAIRRNRRGILHSIDSPTRQRGHRFGPGDSPVALPPGRSTGWAVPSDLGRGWDLRIGPSEQWLPRLVAEIDELGLFLHDSLHTPSHLAFELTTVRPRLAPGAVVLADNTVWTGRAFPRFAEQIGARVRRRGRSDLVGLRVPPEAEGPPPPKL